MCAGDPIHPLCYLQNLEPFSEIPTKTEKEKWTTDNKPFVESSLPSLLSSCPQGIVVAPFYVQDKQLEPNFPLVSRCLSRSSSVDVVSEEREATLPQPLCRYETENGCEQSFLTQSNEAAESKNVPESFQHCLLRVDFLKAILRSLNSCKICAKVRAQRLCKFRPNIKSDPETFAIMLNISLERSQDARILKWLKDKRKTSFESFRNGMESRTYRRLKQVSKNLKQEICGRLKQKCFFKNRKRLNNSQWSNDRGNLNEAERVLKSRLKRFRKFRKGIKGRFKSQKPVLLPVDSELSDEKGGRKFKSKGEDFASSKNRSMSPKGSSLPNLCSRGVSRSSAVIAKSSKNHQEIPYVGLHSNCEETEDKPATSEAREFFGKASQNTIKLIDKFLEGSSSSKPHKNGKSRSGTLRKRQPTRSLSMEESVPFSAMRKSEFDYYTKMMSKERHAEVVDHAKLSLSADEYYKKKTRSPVCYDRKHYHKPLVREGPMHKTLELSENRDVSRTFKLSTTSVHRPTTLFIKSKNVPSIRFSQESPANDESDYPKMEGFSASLDSVRYDKSPSTRGDEAPTSDFLKRLDSVLSEIVEQEKKKIQRYEKLKSNRSADNLFLLPSQRHLRRKLKVKKRNPKESHYEKSPKRATSLMPPTDIMSRHQSYFMEPKPHKPRILKSDSQSKLLSMRCYQPPRPKPSKRKVLTKRKSFDDKDHSYNETSDESPPASEYDSQDTGEKIPSKDSFDEEFSSLSASSIPAGKERKAERTSQADDEDDTCYGSDHISSDMIERGDSTAKYLFPYKPSFKPGECSIDSAYTESREETPDLHTSDQMLDSFREDSQGWFTSPHIEVNAKEHTSLMQLINDSKKFLLEKIKDSRSYSDKNINQLLSYYSKKWKHIPEREMKIIVRSIRSDLGVRASPKECIEFLCHTNLNSSVKGSSCQNLNKLEPHSIPLRKEVSKEDIIADLTTTLPEYLKVHQWNRKTLSTSSSPEPCHHSTIKGTSAEFQNTLGVEGSEPPLATGLLQEAGAAKEERTDSECKREDRMEEGCQLITDEEWIKQLVGEATFKEMESIINEIKSQGLRSDSDPQDLEKMASEICKQFSITF